MSTPSQPIRLTAYSHGAGCGCKLSPKVLGTILENQWAPPSPRLLVGNEGRDDASVFLLEQGDETLISTLDFFMPVVDDPETFGRIAAANAISDIYAMGGRPLMALAILGWPIDKIDPKVAGEVVRGGRATCAEAGIPLAGGHSIDCPEPIFGLSVNGSARRSHVRTNAMGKPGDLLFLTKPLGVGILTTACKKGLVTPDHLAAAVASMTRLNRVGADLATLPSVHALTDVTGFGLVGHLSEICLASGCAAEINTSALVLLPGVRDYLAAGAIPGGSKRNQDSYGTLMHQAPGDWMDILHDPQTSGGLLFSLDPKSRGDLSGLFARHGLEPHLTPVGHLVPSAPGVPPLSFT